jgi:hypothetical protein
MFPATEKWMRKKALEQECAEFQLAHVTGDGESATVEVSGVSREKDIEGQLQACLAAFTESLETHRQEFTKPQRYAVIACSATGRILGQQTFRMKPAADSLDTGETEPPTASGVQAQSMRHLEFLHRSYALQVSAVNDRAFTMLEKALRRIEDLEDRRVAEFELREKLLSQQSEREIAEYQARSEQERKDRMLEQFAAVAKPLLPEVLKKVGLMPGASDGEKSVVQAFFATLSEDQQEKMVGLLTQEQLAILIPLLPAGEKG